MISPSDVLASDSPTPEISALPPGRNRLGDETSPYLLQHKDNPVQWWAWGAEALETARTHDRPILVSVGYSACHWCHVMAHESFDDPAVAALMNRLYVNIKVDREERPDIDAIYQKALSLMGEHGGWPLTMFISPDGQPFWGGTYFPPKPAYGRPSFTDVLTQIDRVWREMREEVVKQSSALVAEIGKHPHEQLRDGMSAALLDDAAVSLLDHVDPDHGGLKGAPKFPMPFVYDFLWRMGVRSGNAELRDAVLKTLHGLCEGGIYDHVGGGFARYSTDQVWLVPHFEKMLYDNAQMIDLLTMVWRDTREAVFENRVAETIDWLIREMIADNDAFAAALDADSDGEEGAFYVWTPDALDQILGADAAVFKAAYDVTPEGNWEGKTILNRSAFPYGSGDEERLEHCRDVLLEARETRTRPGRDDKALADWNGLLIAALTRAGMTFHNTLWLEAAHRAFAAVCKTMTWTDDQGRARLGHTWCAGRLQQTAMLDDYANMINAALALYEATGLKSFLARAEEWAATATAFYWDDESGGYFFTSSDSEGLIVRTKTANDSATPSGNGAIAAGLARLFYLTGAPDYRTRAGATIAALSVDALRAFPHAAVLLSSFILLEEAVQVVIIGHLEARETQAMLAAAHDAAEPNLIVSVIADGASLPASHAAHGKIRVDGRTTAYICRGPVCDAPVTRSEALTLALV